MLERAKFKLNPGKVLGFWGKSGCGKTSLLRAIAGLDYHSSSEVWLNGTCWQKEGGIVPVSARAIGFVFQAPSLFDFKNVEKNLKFALDRSNGSIERHEWFNRVVELAGVGDLLHRMPDTLSGGQRQRVAIARSLCTQPKLLLLDEPMSALDYKSKVVILAKLREVVREFGIPCIYVSHHLEEIARISDSLAFIENGRIVQTCLLYTSPSPRDA